MNEYFKNETGYADQKQVGEALVCLSMAMKRFAMSGMDSETYSDVGRNITDIIHKVTPYLSSANKQRFERYLLKKIDEMKELNN